MFGEQIITLKEKLFSDITEIPEIFKPSHFSGLDGLRGISILIVVFCHLSTGTKILKYIDGDIGVEIFFVISGFLITTLLLKEKVKFRKVSLRKFYIRRALRIIPVGYLYLLILLIFNIICTLRIPIGNFLAAFLYLDNIPFKQTTFFWRYEWYTGHFWSLSVEEQFYICFPFFIARKLNSFLIFAIITTALIPFINYVIFQRIGVFYSNPIAHFLAFGTLVFLGKGTASILVGSIYSILIFKKAIVVDKVNTGYFTSFVLFILSLFLLTRMSPIYVDYFSIFLFPYIIGYIIVANLKKKSFFWYILNNSLLKHIGTLSYSIYIWQQMFTSKYATLVFGYPNSIFIRITLLYIVSFCSYRYFESFFLRYKAKFKLV